LRLPLADPLREDTMSLDKSLKKASSLARVRNVLNRAERLALLQEDERWAPKLGVYNLPKTKYRRLAPGQSGPKRPDAKA
jgi:small basic protein (TIGR04137 family)